MPETPARPSPGGRALLPILHGTSGLFIGVGLARFSFTPVIPLLIRDGWYPAKEAQLLGAWGLVGYLIGGLAAQRLARLLPPTTLSAMMAGVVALSFLICAFPVDYPVAAFWRLVAGFAGAVLMITGTAEAAARLAEMGAGRSAGILFTGVGAGAVVAAVLMPVFAEAPVRQIGAALTLIATASLALHVWAGWHLPPRPLPHSRLAAPRTGSGVERAILWVILAYALDGVGVTPHAVYLVDFATREVGLSAGWAALAWAAFGLGAIFGPLVLMRRSHRLLFPVFLIKALAVATVTVTAWPPAWVLSGFAVGFCTPGIAVLIARFIQYAAGPQSFIRYWAWATTAFALMQMAGGFMAAGLNQAMSGYTAVFLLAAAALLAGSTALRTGERVLDRHIANR